MALLLTFLLSCHFYSLADHGCSGLRGDWCKHTRIESELIVIPKQFFQVIPVLWTICPCLRLRTEYVLKTDDDIYVNIPKLYELVRGNRKPSLLMGTLICNAVPIKAGSSNKSIVLVFKPLDFSEASLV